ncbi:MAG: hypothetical protein HIU93_03025 [Acidobacteria bacterium]|nr:hypothetical protein [Acidobacteriota bacterium]MBW4044514.1 hypothetical protein [Acidobacteriota bacterium]
MPKKTKPLSFDEIVSRLRSLQFDVRPASQGANGMLVAKYGCAAVLAPAEKGQGAVLTVKSGVLLAGEIAHILDRGFQKMLTNSKITIAATADRLKALHLFQEELTEVIGAESFYNQALGTTSDVYMYDRVKGRDLPAAKRPVPAWELPAETH